MGIQYTGIPVLAITIIILVIAPVSSSRNIHRITLEEENDQSFKPQHHSNHPWHTPTEAAAPRESSNNELDPLYGVSQRTVPGGPNPLHN
ncbi:hypothetical protein Tco_1468678 [Tanacetum coccineum]